MNETLWLILIKLDLLFVDHKQIVGAEHQHHFDEKTCLSQKLDMLSSTV